MSTKQAADEAEQHARKEQLRHRLLREEALLSGILMTGLVGNSTACEHLNAALTALAPLLQAEVHELPPWPTCPPPEQVPAVLEQVRERLLAVPQDVLTNRHFMALGFAARRLGFARLTLQGGVAPRR